MHKTLAVITGLIAAVVLLTGGLWAGMTFHQQIAEAFSQRAMTAAATPPATLAAAPRQLYMCGMDHHIQDHPGACDICGMQVVPLNPDAAVSGSEITIDPVMVQNMGLRVAKVERGTLERTLRVVGTLVEPEQNHVEVNLRVSGWIQKLYANQEGMPVGKGNKLFDLYSPELTAATDDLINARKALDASPPSGDAVARTAGAAMLDAARRKLQLLGLEAADVDAMEKLDKAPSTITFTSPMTGHVVDKAVVEGSSVKAGDRVMRIADRSTMWLQMQVYEQQLPLVHVGTPVRAQINGLPGKTFAGAVEFIYPHLDMMARTATARMTIANQGHELHEGMFAAVEIQAQVADAAILVPREAVIDSGTRQIVFLALEGGHFDARQVTIGETGRGPGSDGDDCVQVLTGLAGNETVVTSGQFLLDSESRMREAIQKHLRQHLVTISAASVGAVSQMAAPETRPGEAVAAGATDGLFAAYLALQHALVGADKPVQAGPLSSAATAAAGRLPQGDARTLAGEIASKSLELQSLPLDKQREIFKALSAAAIKLAGEAPPSAAVVPDMYVFHCPMAQADWLQPSDQTANPYLSDMMTCGTMTRKIGAPGPETRP